MTDNSLPPKAEKLPWSFLSMAIFSTLFGSIAGFLITWQNLKRLGKKILAKKFFFIGGAIIVLIFSISIILLIRSRNEEYEVGIDFITNIFSRDPDILAPFLGNTNHHPFLTLLRLVISLSFPFWFFLSQIKKEVNLKLKFSWSIIFWGLLGFFITILQSYPLMAIDKKVSQSLYTELETKIFKSILTPTPQEVPAKLPKSSQIKPVVFRDINNNTLYFMVMEMKKGMEIEKGVTDYEFSESLGEVTFIKRDLDNNIHFYNIRTGKFKEIVTKEWRLRGIKRSPDGKYIVTDSGVAWEGGGAVYDYSSGKKVMNFVNLGGSGKWVSNKEYIFNEPRTKELLPNGIKRPITGEITYWVGVSKIVLPSGEIKKLIEPSPFEDYEVADYNFNEHILVKKKSVKEINDWSDKNKVRITYILINSEGKTIDPNIIEENNPVSEKKTQNPEVYSLQVTTLKKTGPLRYYIVKTLGICSYVTDDIEPCASFFYDSNDGRPDNKNKFTLYIILKTGKLETNRVYKDENFEITVSLTNSSIVPYLQNSKYCQENDDCYMGKEICYKGPRNKYYSYYEGIDCIGCSEDEELNSEKGCCEKKIFTSGPYCKNNQCQIDYTIDTNSCRKIGSD